MKKKHDYSYVTAFPPLRARNLTVILVGLFVVLVASGLSAFWGSITLFVIVGLILALFIFRYPFFGLLFFVGLIPLESTFSTIGGAVTVTRLLGFYILGLWVLRVVFERRQITLPQNANFFIPFLIWALLSVFWGVDKSLTLGYWSTLLQMFIFVLLICNQVANEKQLMWILMVLLFSCILVALLGYFRVGSLGERSLLSLESVGAKEYSSMVGVAFLSCTFLFLHASSKKLKFLLLMAVAICIYPLFASGERGVFLGLITGWIAIAMAGKRKSSMFGLALMIGVMFYVAFQLAVKYELLSHFIISRYSFENIIETGGTGRMDIWRVAFNIIGYHPVWGVGLGNFVEAYQHYAPSILAGSYADSAVGPHSDLIGIMAELGLIGLVLFICLLSSTGTGLVKLFWRSLKPEAAMLSAWLLGLWIYYLTISLSTTLMYRKFYWLLIALVEVAINLYQKNCDKDSLSQSRLQRSHKYSI